MTTSRIPLEDGVSHLLSGMYREYALGDFVRIWLANHGGEMTEGRVILRFIPEGDTEWLYVIEMEHEMGSNYEVRSGSKLEMRPSAGAMEYESWFTPCP